MNERKYKNRIGEECSKQKENCNNIVLPVQPFTMHRNPSGASDSAHVTIEFHGFPVKAWY